VKVSPDTFRTARRQHPTDVLDEDEPGARLDDDAAGCRPEVSLVFFAELLAGKTVRLARDAANEAIHKAAPWSAVEGSGIAPNRRWSHETLFKRADQMRAGESFPLHVHDWDSTRHREFKPEVEPSSA
jgi:hypothetical protein